MKNEVEKEVIGIVLAPGTKQKIRDYVSFKDMTVAQFMRRIVNEFLESKEYKGFLKKMENES